MVAIGGSASVGFVHTPSPSRPSPSRPERRLRAHAEFAVGSWCLVLRPRTSPSRTSWYKQLAPRDLLGPLGTSTLSPPQAGPRVLEIWDNNGCRHNRHAEASAQRNLEMQSRHRAWCVLVGPTRADAEASVQRTGWRSVQAVQGVPPQRESARQTRLRARSLAAPSQTYLATSSSGPFGFAEARSSRFRRSRGALNGPLPSRSWSYPSASRAATGPSGCVPLRERVGRVHREFVRVAKRKKN